MATLTQTQNQQEVIAPQVAAPAQPQQVAPQQAPVAQQPIQSPEPVSAQPEVNPNAQPEAIEPAAPLASNQQKINGIMLWYAIATFAYASAFNKTVMDIQTSSDGNGLFLLDTSAAALQPVDISTMQSEKQVSDGALKYNKATIHRILSSLPEQEAAETRTGLHLDANLDPEV